MLGLVLRVRLRSLLFCVLLWKAISCLTLAIYNFVLPYLAKLYKQLTFKICVFSVFFWHGNCLIAVKSYMLLHE